MSIKPSLLTALTAGSICVVGIVSLPSQAQGIRFVCKLDSMNIPTTYAQTPEGYRSVFKWGSNYFLVPAFAPMSRCQEITERMNTFSAHGKLDHLSSGKIGSRPYICAGKSCDSSGNNVLLMLSPNEDSNLIIQVIEDILRGAGTPPLYF